MTTSQHWRARFAALMTDKTRRAIAAVLPPYETELGAADPQMVSIGNAWSLMQFDGPFFASPANQSRPVCSLVFVQSADGNTGARDPASLGGGEADKHVIYEGLSRVGADAVLVGAQTMRDGDLVFSVWHPELVELRASLGLPRHPVQIVATAHGLDLDAMLLFNVPEIPVVLMTLATVAEPMRDAFSRRPWITPIVMRRPEELPSTVAQLRSMGIGRVSCIGGRTIAAQLLDAKLVDDVYLTTAARPGGEPHTPLHSKPWRGRLIVRKRGTDVEAGVVFEHVLPR